MTDGQRPVKAVCHRCGGPKLGPFVPCKTCEFVPLGEDRPIAWLFGLDYLTEEEMLEAGRRIRGGEVPDPSQALRELAREGMGAVPLSTAQLKPLTTWQILLLSLGNLVLTPLIGGAMWYGMREDRPVAAAQIARMTVPVAAGLTLMWIVLLVSQL
jgi:hypothetical protein